MKSIRALARRYQFELLVLQITAIALNLISAVIFAIKIFGVCA